MNRQTTNVLREMIDADWVLDQYGLAPKQVIKLFKSGHPDGLNLDPNGVFNCEWYRRIYEIPESVPAAVHYAAEGWAQGNYPSQWFDAELYRGSGAPIDETVEPLGHFLAVGRNEGWLPLMPMHFALVEVFEEPRLSDIAACFRRSIKAHAMVDFNWFAWRFGFENSVEAELYYWSEGFKKHDPPNAFLDPEWYLDHNPDVADAGWSPMLHYMVEGWNQGRNPSQRLSLEWFWKHNGHVEPIKAIGAQEYLPGSIAPVYETRPPHRLNDLQLASYYTEQPLTGPSTPFDSSELDIHWIVPDFGPGSGGHTNIFRFARMLSDRGHKNTIWVDRPRTHGWNDDLADDLRTWYGNEDTPIEFLPPEPAIYEIEGDAVIATGWQTTYSARTMPGFRRRFCMVQDYESMFSPRGSHYFASQATYELDFDCFCASPWLQHLMRERHGRWADMFWLAPNTEIYYPADTPPDNALPLIAAYARDHTSRRCVELLEAALTIIARRGIPVAVEAFGLSDQAMDRWRRLGIEVRGHAYLEPDKVAELYRRADLGVSLSGTNYSSVPPDMMACGLPVLDLRTEATEMTYADGVVALAEPSAVGVADGIAELLGDRKRLAALANRGKEWIDRFTWDDGADMIERGIVERIQSAGVTDPEVRRTATKKPLATVVIPTYNGGQLFGDVCRAVLAQECDFEFELYVVDSSSSDETAEIAAGLDCRFEVIDQRNFQHGRTRNYAVENAQGSFVALLTQDALPQGTNWLQNLVAPMLADHDVAGVFGRHVAHEGANQFTAEEMDRHFEGFLEHPRIFSRRLDSARYRSGDPGWRQLLYFYSDNNSCLRKSIWRTLPYPAVPFGEDQAWAQLAIDAGWSKAYAPDAVVAHSHDFGVDETRFRASEEAKFFRDWFGLMAMVHPNDLDSRFKQAEKMIEQIGERLGATPEEINEQRELLLAKLHGMRDGAHGFLSPKHA